MLSFRPIVLNAFLLVITVVTGLPGITCAQTQTPEHNIGDQGITAAYLGQLQSPRFAQRRNASRSLKAMGLGAHKILQEIAQSDEAESATRALDLLSEATRSSDPQIAESAREALRGIAASEGPRATSAGQALRPAQPIAELPFFRPGQRQLVLPPVQRPVQWLGQRLAQRPGFAPGRRTNLRISIRNMNGIREIEVVENDKTYKFRDAGNGLETQRPDGMGGVKKQTYKDADELQQKDPEAFRAYQQAGGNKGGVLGNAIQIRGTFGSGIPPVPLPQ